VSGREGRTGRKLLTGGKDGVSVYEEEKKGSGKRF